MTAPQFLLGFFSKLFLMANRNTRAELDACIATCPFITTVTTTRFRTALMECHRFHRKHLANELPGDTGEIDLDLAVHLIIEITQAVSCQQTRQPSVEHIGSCDGHWEFLIFVIVGAFFHVLEGHGSYEAAFLLQSESFIERQLSRVLEPVRPPMQS